MTTLPLLDHLLDHLRQRHGLKPERLRYHQLTRWIVELRLQVEPSCGLALALQADEAWRRMSPAEGQVVFVRHARGVCGEGVGA